MEKPVPLKIRYYLQAEMLVKLGDQYYEIAGSSDGKYVSRELTDDEVKAWDKELKVKSYV